MFPNMSYISLSGIQHRVISNYKYYYITYKALIIQCDLIKSYLNLILSPVNEYERKVMNSKLKKERKIKNIEPSPE